MSSDSSEARSLDSLVSEGTHDYGSGDTQFSVAARARGVRRPSTQIELWWSTYALTSEQQLTGLVRTVSGLCDALGIKNRTDVSVNQLMETWHQQVTEAGEDQEAVMQNLMGGLTQVVGDTVVGSTANVRVCVRV
eukprot:Blabericola_migrator_1__1071@NODE_1273_length_4923_cov_16_538715_g858_i0_p2_GENE_NODE_1273_length_4923_cov_16_538715_g858_i0NODE_1273_length_4923_cov_16_538715_g858_i0_p2_ORF_typecomplete_len135_score22_25Tape_meas_lam_C/PF09718_10/8_9e03Tape_meas_lam_C/PF09718_10/0_11OTCace_N/PF02729_21/0_11_NODE_1273_length_4923_cov_16_538715_g858_i036694073